MLVIISVVLRRSLGTLDFLGAQTQIPDLCKVMDFLLLKLRQPLPEVI